MRDKRANLEDVVASVADGASVALGGNTLHRAPCAFVHELVRQQKRDLTVIKTAASYDVDLLAGSGVITRAEVAFVGFENVFGLAPRYRHAVETGALQLKEHACYSVISGLRAAAQGVPFMPIAGMFGSDVVERSGFRSLTDPYTGQSVVTVPAIRPDVAVVHVQEADREGNARIYGTRFEDVLIAQAAQRVIVTCERIVDGSLLAARPEMTAIPGYLVEAVVEAPRGAWPLSCADEYDYDHDYLAAYIRAAQDDAAYADFIAAHILAPAAAL
ncbi:MAG: CoA-transferase [Anaerolineae bacterium]